MWGKIKKNKKMGKVYAIGHTNIHGNECADELAILGAARFEYKDY